MKDSRTPRIIKHPFRLTFLSIGISMSVWYAPFSGDISPLIGILYLLPLALLAGAYKTPFLYLPLFVIGAIAFDIVFPNLSANLLYALLTATSLWAYTTDIQATISFLLALSNYQILWMCVQHGENHALRMSLSYVCLNLLAALAGQIAQARKRTEYRQKMQILKLIRANNRIALQIHNACSHNFARIDYAIREVSDDTSEINNVSSVIQNSITDLRSEINTILKTLQNVNNKQEYKKKIPGCHLDCILLIRQQCNVWQQRLHSQGLQGVVRLIALQNPREYQSENLRLVKLCLDEIFTNIYRHAAPNSKFSVQITISEKCVSIIESNKFTDQPSTGMGQGIELLRKEILALGGVWTNVHSEKWNSYIEIPLCNHYSIQNR